METSLTSKLSDFLREEKIKMKLREISDSEFWLEGPYGFLTAKFRIDKGNHRVLYDLFSPKYDVHLKEETLRDVEKLDIIVEERGKWDYEKSIEGLWLVLDCVKLWAHENKFSVKEKILI
ncbi:MAG TPA: hypothetical protein VMT42_02555 [candidate division Zixibacteria bacterium]|nr:hypothetical protein [candidate division Zixibacteria bacterium]